MSPRGIKRLHRVAARREGVCILLTSVKMSSGSRYVAAIRVPGRHVLKRSWFDDLLETLAAGGTRRATLAALAQAMGGAGLFWLLGDDAEARRKRKRRKRRRREKQRRRQQRKRKCKGGTKRCGKRCIPTSACCGDCPRGEPGGTDCDGDGDCGPDQRCTDGNCVCTNSNDITCGAICCNSNDQVCEFGNAAPTCVAAPNGVCPASNFCNDATFYACSNTDEPQENCVCALTADDPSLPECVIYQYTQPPADCTPCEHSADCAGGQFCILGNTSSMSYCGCDNNFCVWACPWAPLVER